MQPIRQAGINGTRQVSCLGINVPKKPAPSTLYSLLNQDLLINVNYDGTVSCTPTALVSVACKTDVANFPYDIKNCKLTFGR